MKKHTKLFYAEQYHLRCIAGFIAGLFGAIVMLITLIMISIVDKNFAKETGFYFLVALFVALIVITVVAYYTAKNTAKDIEEIKKNE